MKNERNSKDRVKKKLIVENCIERKNDNIVSRSDIQYS